MTRNMFSSSNPWRGLVFSLLSVFLLLMPFTAHSDEIGELLLKEILANPDVKLSNKAKLLITKDLKWYGANMKHLPQTIQNEVQAFRIHVVGEATRLAAESMNEGSDRFFASGSCAPSRDVDLLYVGQDVKKANNRINSAIKQVTKDILAEGGDDPLLKAVIDKKIKIPESLDSKIMDVVTSDLPDFGHLDMNNAIDKARAAKKAGKSIAIDVLKKDLLSSLQKNLDAQVKSKAKDMYRGAAGQRFFALNYLGNPEKVRRIVKDGAGSWTLKSGGLEAMSGVLREKVEALMPSSRRAKFAKVASDYTMYFKHGAEAAGISGTAKYVDRIWGDVDEIALLTYMGDDETRAMLAARRIAKDPNNASVILAGMKLNEDQVVDGIKRAMGQTVENQLLLDVNKLLTEIEQVDAAKAANKIGDIEVFARKHALKFDINDLANGLSAMSEVPNTDLEKILKTLHREFDGRDMGTHVLGYIENQLKLFTGESANLINLRILKTLLVNKEIAADEYFDLKRRIQLGEALPDGIPASKLKQAKQEILFLSSVDMLEIGGNPNSIDNVVDDWRRQRSNALIRAVPDEIRQTVKELKTLPAGDLKALGWLEVEIKLPMETRLRIKILPGQMADMATKLQSKLGKQAISLMQWQRQTRKYIFSLTPTEFGEVGDLGPMDGVFSVATGLFQTYSILNSGKPMTLEQENLALANAWVTSLPIVGDFAEGIIAGIDAGFTGNKRKALEAGLFLTIGVMGVVPGGQIPAMVTGLVMAGTPIAEGIYDARQAQNLVQAWISSGRWEGGGNQPMVLTGVFDRAGLVHPLTYKYLLTRKGNVPYESEKTDGMFSVPTINGSIREYAENYVFPQYPKIKEFRESLKHLFPRFSDKDWEDEFDAKLKVKVHGGKAALVFFRQYHQIRTQALNHTIAQLKEWAEEEFRVANDYEGEINRAKEELRGLEAELRVRNLVSNADRSAQAYTKIIKNAMEHETLPLSRYRIYKHYLQEYRQIAVIHRKINKYLAEVPKGYKPTNWHLTGFPEFDRPRITKLLAMIKNGRAHAVTEVARLIRDFGFTSKGGYDPDNTCQKKSLQILLGYRYKIAFIDNLIEYFNTLADSESAWSDAYESARSRYIGVRDRYSSLPKSVQVDVAHKAIGDAVMTFVAAMPYALASGERDLYRGTARDFKLKMNKAMRDYKYAAFMTGEAGKALETCLMASLKIEITLSPLVPKKGKTTIAKGKLISSLPPGQKFWHWKVDGELILDSRYGPKVEVTVNGPGTLMVEVVDDFRNSAKLLAKANMRVVPSEDEIDADKDKEKDESKEEEKDKKEDEKEEQPELTEIDVTLKGPTKVVTVGTKVTLSSSVGGGRGPYQYKWSGVSSSSSTASFTPSHVGDLSISIVVTDADGISSEAVTTVRVGPAKVKLKGVKGQVFYGTKAILSASGMGLQKPIPTPIPIPIPISGKIDCTANPGNPFCVSTDSDSTHTPTQHQKTDIPDDTNEGHYVPDPDNEGYVEVEEHSMPNPLSEFDDEPSEVEEYKVVWQSEPGLTFKPPQGPDPTTEVTYDRVGEIKVWCELLKFIDGAYQTVAESEQVIVNVVSPDFSISYEPANGQAYVGQQVIATIHAKPKVSTKLIDYRWLDPATSNRLDMENNASRIAFKVRDINPIKLKVLARVPVHGDELSEIESSYTGMAYGVNAWMVQPPNLPRTWDPKAGGFKTIKRGSRAAGEQITLKAVVEGGTVPAGVRWKWTVNKGTAISNDISQTPRVSRSEAGEITARVVATNKNGNKLGTASVTISVIKLVSPPKNFKKPGKPKTAPQKKAAAEKMVKQAQDQLARGDMPAAEKSVLAAKEIDPKTAAPVIKQIATAAKTSGWRAVNLWDFPKAKENLEVADRLAPGNADTQKKLKKLQAFQKIWPRVEAKVTEFDKYVAEKKPFSAQKALLEMQKLQHGIPGGGSSPLRQRISEDFNRAFDEYRAVILELEQQNTKFFKKKNWQGVLDISLPVLNRELDQNRRKRIQGNIDFARKKLAEEQKKAKKQSKDPSNTIAKETDTRSVAKDPSQPAKDIDKLLSDPKSAPPELRSVEIPAPANEPQKSSNSGYQLDLDKTIYAPNENIKLTFVIPNKIPKNTWIGLIPSHVNHGSTKTNDKHDITFQRIYSKQPAEMIFKAPKKVGKYDLRMSTSDGNRELISVTFTVGVPNHLAILLLPKKIFAPKEKITVGFKATKLLPNNSWVGLLPAEVKHGSTKLNDQHDTTYQTLFSKESGKLVFTAPKEVGKYDFRMNETTNDKELASVDFEVAVPMAGNELLLLKRVFAPKEKIQLDFKTSKLLPSNSWIGLLPADVEHGSTKLNNKHDITYQTVFAKESGHMVFNAPRQVGKYDFRMNETTNDKELVSVAFEVAVPMDGNELILDKKVYAPKEKITLEFKASPLLPSNSWVGLLPANIVHGSTKKNSLPDIPYKTIYSKASGQMIFNAPKKVGKYDFRMNETTNDKELVSVTFEVAVPMDGNELILAKKVYAPKEQITLKFNASPLLPSNSWVGLLPANIAHGSTKNNDQHDIVYKTVYSKASGQMIFNAPKKIGKYDFRMNETTNDKELISIAFEVAVPMDDNQLTLSKNSFVAGEKIIVNFKASPLLPSNSWIGLIPANVEHGSTKRNDKHDITYQTVYGKSSGQMIFKAPKKPGKYSFRMNETTNDKEVTHVLFTVIKGKK